ncbi:OCIA domain-containing protein 1 [Fundulus heteroclitus]|uniref:OCIA domain-containing protein 1 n=2 Tax=Fundulus heteroclitus TaxID=8078 RepID=A0A3Q2P9I1_FUNHE|nr:OCIA domain-containing protein 1 [Fundulus heteroclitus]
MTSSPPGLTEERQGGRGQQALLGAGYIPTEEEKRVLKECNSESLYYRSLPFSVVSMAVTQALVVRGTLSPSPRFGSLPKVAFAGFCGYMAGKLSYMKTCQEKFQRLENSPLGEILRQRAGIPPHDSGGAQSELSDPNSPSFDTMFQPGDAPGAASSQSRDPGYGFSPDRPVQMGRADDFSAPVQSYVQDDEEPRKKAILYEDLRLKNRENYEVTLIQKADTMLKGPSAKDPEGGKKPVKKNIYGDTWEE